MPLSPPPVHPDSKNAAKQRMSTSSESVAGLAHSESDVTTASSSTVGPEEFGQQLEDIDLATFLARQSRDFSEATVKEAARVRQLRWQTVDVQPWEHSGYLDTFEACLARISEYVPPDMLTDYYVSESEDGGDTKLSMSRLRGAGERLYMLVPPSKIFSIRSHVRDLAYWRDRQKTLFAALAYLIALYQDLVPAFLLSVSILLIVKRRLFPPSSTQLRADVLERRQLAKEAKDIGADFQLRGQLHHFGSFMATPSSTSKTGAAASVVDDDAPRELDEAATPPPPLSPTSSISSTTALPSPSRRNTLSLAREVGSRFGPDIQLLLEEIANTGEKLRNLVLFRDSAASWRVLSIWSAFALLLFVIPASVIPRALFAWLGLHVFAFAYLRHRFPRYRRFFNPINWLLIGLPTDAQAARGILHRRAASGQTVTTLRDLKRADRQAVKEESFEMPAWNKDLGRRDNMRVLGQSLFTQGRKRFTQAKDIVNAYSFDKDSDHKVGVSFFCFQGRTPGRIVLESEHLRFDGIKGFSSSKNTTDPVSPATASTSADDPLSPPLTPDPSQKFTRIAFKDMASVKKASSFGDPSQLLISCSDGRLYKLSKVADRGEAFLKILLKCPQLASVSG